MSATSTTQQHVDEGNRFLAIGRPADAAAEFTMAIRASAPNPNSDALIGRAFALLGSDASQKDSLAAFAEARPYGKNDPNFMESCIRYYLIVYYAYSKATQNKNLTKKSKELHKDAVADMDSMIASFKGAAERNDSQACVWAAHMVDLADWMDEYEKPVSEEYAPGVMAHPFRDLAPRLYRPVAETEVAQSLTKPELRDDFQRDVTGRAQRQLVYRGNDAAPKKGNKSAGSTGTSGVRSLSWKVLAILIVVGVVLLMVKWWVGGLVLLAAAGYVLYQLKMKAA